MTLCWVVFVCAGILAVLVARRGLPAKARVGALVGAALLGAGAFPIAGWLEDALVRFGGATPTPASIAILAGLVEESAKFIAAICVGLAFHGLRGPGAQASVAYGSLAGLGMAALEAATYHHKWLTEGWSFLPHQVPRLYVHMVLGGIAAWGARRGGRISGTRILRAMAVLASAAAVHATLDWTSLAPDVLRWVPGAPNSVQVALVVSATGFYALLHAKGAGSEASDAKERRSRGFRSGIPVR